MGVTHNHQMHKDWYRRKSWTVSDQEEFFTKLNRARKDNRAQYLKIQAMEFVETGKHRLLDAAEQLLNRLLEEYPDDNFNRSSSLHTLGDIYRRRNKLDVALEYYWKAVEFEKQYPNVQTQADIDFSDLVVKLEKVESYSKVEMLMNDRVKKSLFPIEKYRGYSILSIINKRLGKDDLSDHFRELAEQNASSKTSGLRYHQNLGTVKKRDSWLDRILKGR